MCILQIPEGQYNAHHPAVVEAPPTSLFVHLLDHLWNATTRGKSKRLLDGWVLPITEPPSLRDRHRPLARPSQGCPVHFLPEVWTRHSAIRYLGSALRTTKRWVTEMGQMCVMVRKRRMLSSATFPNSHIASVVVTRTKKEQSCRLTGLTPSSVKSQINLFYLLYRDDVLLHFKMRQGFLCCMCHLHTVRDHSDKSNNRLKICLQNNNTTCLLKMRMWVLKSRFLADSN